MAGAATGAAEAARAAQDDDLLAQALVLAGSAAVLSGRGDAELTEAHRLAATTGDAWASAHAGAARGQGLLRAGDLEGSERALREAEAVARALGSPFTLATELNGRASLALARGDDDAALDLLTEAVELAARIGTSWTLAYALPALAALAARRGDPELAAELYAAGAEASSVTVAYPPEAVVAHTSPAGVRAELGDEAFARAWERGRGVRPDAAPRLVARLTRPAAPS
jgi:ATP/maltotriose-dependent transcriptional regulator MalT